MFKSLIVGCFFLLPSLVLANEQAANRLAHQVSGFVEAKAKADYEQKLKSIQGLLSAHKRITNLNSDTAKELTLQKKVTPFIKKAEQLAEKHLFKEAKVSLENAYIATITSIRAQRTGQTLVRSLDFATEKEAYEYELGRYENYKMLVNMMIDERHAFERDSQTKPFFDEENRYHAQADALVEKGQYGEAAKHIEKASKSLVNLLRNSGIYIPGV
ncbi:hypothetical protein MNBD_GAMMA04-2228 [hydrothermal vent metagenome]|uniref:Uncharacterized protein n=1 Tax=hydrothermal vent metagenome TaxID=652676 RepID=A0A3B0WMY8_9ZZZZ